MSLIVPSSCRAFDSVNRFLNDLVEDNRHPIGSFHFLDLSESLKNGGGPACLRLRVVMNATELEEMNPGVLFTEKLYQELVAHVNQYYPTELSLKDLADPKLYEQNCASLDQISKILNLGNIYSFQNP